MKARSVAQRLKPVATRPQRQLEFAAALAEPLPLLVVFSG